MFANVWSFPQEISRTYEYLKKKPAENDYECSV
jgi:hypothetical protein